MGVFDRLANLAKGKVMVWRRGASAPVPVELEEELRRRPPRTSEGSLSEPTTEPGEVRRPVPNTPRKRRL